MSFGIISVGFKSQIHALPVWPRKCYLTFMRLNFSSHKVEILFYLLRELWRLKEKLYKAATTMLGTQVIFSASPCPPFLFDVCCGWQWIDTKGSELGLVNPFSMSSSNCPTWSTWVCCRFSILNSQAQTPAYFGSLAHLPCLMSAVWCLHSVLTSFLLHPSIDTTFHNIFGKVI